MIFVTFVLTGTAFNRRVQKILLESKSFAIGAFFAVVAVFDDSGAATFFANARAGIW